MRMAGRYVAMLVALLMQSAPLAAAGRVALVVGNSAYAAAPPLANPVNDATDVADRLRSLGFTVILAADASRQRFEATLREFSARAERADVALFYFAGHGLQVGEHNYLLPVDARLINERDLDLETIRLELVLRQIEIGREGKTSIVILDACRDNPLARGLARTMGTRSAAVGRGLGAAAAGLGTFIAYATQPGNVALDGERTRNSPFTSALLKHMGVAGRNLPATMIEVRKDVVAQTGGRQVPWDHSALTGDFYFVAATGRPGAGSPGAAADPDIGKLNERLRQLEEEARQRATARPGAAEPRAAVGPVPPVTPRRDPSAEAAAQFEDLSNVRLDGTSLRSFRASSPAACRLACAGDPACIAYNHGRRIPVMSECRLYSSLTARVEDPAWYSGVRRSDAGTAGGSGSQRVLPAGLATRAATSVAGGFAHYESVALQGEIIKSARSGTARGCAVVCRNTPGCVAAGFSRSGGSGAGRCDIFRSLEQADTNQPGNEAVVRQPGG